jgi:predicted dehydrogenase
MAIGWGIVGLGGWSDRHMAPAIRQAKDTRLVGVVSRDKAKAQQFATHHGAAHAYDRLEDLLSNPEVDVVCVMTPNNLHAEAVIAAAQRGKHVLCGIAMAASEEDCLAMVEACKRHNVRLGTDFQTRYNPAYRALRQVVASGALGDVVSARCVHCLPWSLRKVGEQVWNVPTAGALAPGSGSHGNNNWKEDLSMRGAGVMSSPGMFGIDMLRYILGRDVETVYGFSDVATAPRTQETIVEATLGFQGGIPASFTCTNHTPYADNSVTVHGAKGSAYCSGMNPFVSDGVLRVRTEQGETVREFHGGNMFVDQVEAFNESVRTGKEPNASGVDGWRERQITLAIRESGMKRSVVKLSV